MTEWMTSVQDSFDDYQKAERECFKENLKRAEVLERESGAHASSVIMAGRTKVHMAFGDTSVTIDAVSYKIVSAHACLTCKRTLGDSIFALQEAVSQLKAALEADKEHMRLHMQRHHNDWTRHFAPSDSGK